MWAVPPPPSTFKGTLGLHWIIQANLFLKISWLATFISPSCHIAYPQVPRIKTQTSLEGPFLFCLPWADYGEQNIERAGFTYRHHKHDQQHYAECYYSMRCSLTTKTSTIYVGFHLLYSTSIDISAIKTRDQSVLTKILWIQTETFLAFDNLPAIFL